MSRSERFAVGIDYQDGVARRRLTAIQNVARENPGMAGSDTAGRFPADAHCVQVFSLPPGGAGTPACRVETRLDHPPRRVSTLQTESLRHGFYFTGNSTGTLDALPTLTITG